MVIIFFVLGLVAINFQYTFGQSTGTKISVTKHKQDMKYAPGEVIVKFKSVKINLKTSGGKLRAQNFAAQENMAAIDMLSNNNIAVMTIEGNESVEQKIIQLQSDPNVEYAQPNFVYKIQMANPNDTDFAKLRGLKNGGQNVNGTVGISGADIHRNEAMDIFSGNGNAATTGTIVAVIDIGVNYNHIDLMHNMRSGVNCVSYTGANLGGCLYGYDFYETGDNDPFPNGNDSHGSHVAGTIGASMNNATGVVGVNPNVKIMAIRAGSGQYLFTDDIIEGINFAKYNGAKIINASRGGGATGCIDNRGYWDQFLYETIRDFPGLVIAAAGNDGYEHLSGYFSTPSDFSATTSCWTGLDNILGVAATDQNDVLTSWSDFSSGSIHVGAPGENIYSTVLANGYDYSNGTSMATPHVAGLASLVWSYRPDLNYSDIKNAIIQGGDSLVSLSGKTVSGKRINAYTTLFNLTAAATGSIVFLSGGITNTTGVYLRLSASKMGTYQLSGADMIGVFTGNIGLTGLDVFVQLTTGDDVKNVGVIFFDTIGKQSQLYTASIILDTTSPSVPLLLSPISGTNISGSVNLLWNASVDTGGMSGYYYEVSNDSGMSNVILTGIISVTGGSLNLFSGDTYYRRVRSFDIFGQNSDFSQTGNFVLLRDIWPDIFIFNSVNSAELTTEYISNQIIIHGIYTGSQIAITGGTYQLNNTGNFISTTGTVYSGDTVKIKLTSSSSYSIQTAAILDIGGITGSFAVTTKSAPSSPGGGGGGGGGTPTFTGLSQTGVLPPPTTMKTSTVY
ncbi:MAG: S8 family serine peptidase, partial [Candidatus Absconditabacterales bacterium]